MGARWWKAEEAVIRAHYPTATRAEILPLIPNRTWNQIGVKARKMRVLRTSAAKGDSVREGRKKSGFAYTDAENERFDRIYPVATHAELLRAYPHITLAAILSHAQRRHLHRTKEARDRQMRIGREEAKRKRMQKGGRTNGESNSEMVLEGYER